MVAVLSIWPKYLVLINAQNTNWNQVFGFSESKQGGEERGANQGANQNIKPSRPLPNGIRSSVCEKLWRFWSMPPSSISYPNIYRNTYRDILGSLHSQWGKKFLWVICFLAINAFKGTHTNAKQHTSMKMPSPVSMLKLSQNLFPWEVIENALHPQSLLLSYAIHNLKSHNPPARMRNKGGSE